MKIGRMLGTSLAVAGLFVVGVAPSTLAVDPDPTYVLSGIIVGPDGGPPGHLEQAYVDVADPTGGSFQQALVLAADGTFEVALPRFGSPEAPARGFVLAFLPPHEQRIDEHGCLITYAFGDQVFFELDGVGPIEPVTLRLETPMEVSGFCGDEGVGSVGTGGSTDEAAGTGGSGGPAGSTGSAGSAPTPPSNAEGTAPRAPVVRPRVTIPPTDLEVVGGSSAQAVDGGPVVAAGVILLGAVTLLIVRRRRVA